MERVSNRLFSLLLIVILAFISANSCTPVPEADFYEVGGIVSINARSLPEQNNWQLQKTHTSLSMVSQEDTTTSRGALTFPFYVRSPGEYTVYVLVNLTPKIDEVHELPLQILDENRFLLENRRIPIDQTPVLRWRTNDAASGQPVSVNFETPGHYEIRLESGGTGGFVVDKLHLTRNNENQPYGFALPETANPNQDPFLAKRDERIVIPPAWAFGVIYGGVTGGTKAQNLADLLIEENIPADGIWIRAGQSSENFNSDELQETRNYLVENNIMMGIDSNLVSPEQNSEELIPSGLEFNFLKLPFRQEKESVENAFEITMQRSHISESRGFLISPPGVTSHPEFKEFPTLHSGKPKKAWTYDDARETAGLTFGDLREQVELSADLRLSTYEIPYLLHTVPVANLIEDTEAGEELFIRWIQFAAFNTMMHLHITPEAGDGSVFPGFSDRAEQQFRELAELRNRLFPYLYSLAHLVRATREKPVRGDGSQTTQFQLGDALLVAPILEKGEEERMVYLPPGTWYDYWNGSEYEGGTSWIVEAPIDKIPVFVRAGSIIPYRDYSRNILAGKNERLTIEVYGGGASSFRLYEDDGMTTRYRLGEFTTTAFRYFEHPDFSTFTIGRMVRSYQGQAPEKELEIRFKYVDEPIQITANEEELEQGQGENEWWYDQDSETLILNWIQPNYQKTDFVIQY